MSVVTSRTFRDDIGEAVLLPEEVAFGANIEVTIEQCGGGLLVRPRHQADRKRALDDYLARLGLRSP